VTRTGLRAGFEAEALPQLDAVYRFALRLSGSPAAAEDLVQETYLRAWRSWEQYTRGTRVKSWLFTICRNVFLRTEERGRRHADIVETESARGTAQGAASVVNPVWISTLGRDPEADFFDSIVDEEVLQAIDDLPEEYRSAVVLSDLEGLTYEEMAKTLGVPAGTVKSRLFRGRRQLQKVLYEYAVEQGYISKRTRDPGAEEARS